MATPTQEDFSSLSSAIASLTEALGKGQENTAAGTKEFKKNLIGLGTEL